ncbi:GSCOCG00006659001-RA-CDS [Cotesia congregata]|nr:GSCOCG00006659001-RA-CDS [Cotesia congregata]
MFCRTYSSGVYVGPEQSLTDQWPISPLLIRSCTLMLSAFCSALCYMLCVYINQYHGFKYSPAGLVSSSGYARTTLTRGLINSPQHLSPSDGTAVTNVTIFNFLQAFFFFYKYFLKILFKN